MLAKVIAHAPTREQAARLLARSLAQARIHGVVTNRDLLVGIFREPEFLAGQIDTGYLTRHAPGDLVAADPRADEVHAIAVALADQALRRLEAPVLAAVPSGWRNVPNEPQRVEYAVSASAQTVMEVSYRVVTGATQARAEVCVNGGAPVDVLLHASTPDRVDLQIDGVRRVVLVDRDGAARYADSVLGATALTEQPRFPLHQAHVAAGSLVAPMPGSVVRVEAAVGDAVAAGHVLVVLEAMKMEHSVRAPHDGMVTEVCVAAGQQVDQGTVLAVLSEPSGDAPAERLRGPGD
jgi:acetyl/propionyl-CoA carboxylase alpha subunit